MQGAYLGTASLQNLIENSMKMKELRGSTPPPTGDSSSPGFLGTIKNTLGNIFKGGDQAPATTALQTGSPTTLPGAPSPISTTPGMSSQPNFQPNGLGQYKDPSSYATNTRPQQYAPTDYNPNLVAPSPVNTQAGMSAAPNFQPNVQASSNDGPNFNVNPDYKALGSQSEIGGAPQKPGFNWNLSPEDQKIATTLAGAGSLVFPWGKAASGVGSLIGAGGKLAASPLGKIGIGGAAAYGLNNAFSNAGKGPTQAATSPTPTPEASPQPVAPTVEATPIATPAPEGFTNPGGSLIGQQVAHQEYLNKKIQSKQKLTPTERDQLWSYNKNNIASKYMEEKKKELDYRKAEKDLQKSEAGDIPTSKNLDDDEARLLKSSKSFQKLYGSNLKLPPNFPQKDVIVQSYNKAIKGGPEVTSKFLSALDEYLRIYEEEKKKAKDAQQGPFAKFLGSHK